MTGKCELYCLQAEREARDNIRNEQDLAYQQSLEADRRKVLTWTSKPLNSSHTHSQSFSSPEIYKNSPVYLKLIISRGYCVKENFAFISKHVLTS